MKEIRLFSMFSYYIQKQADLYKERMRIQYLKKFNIDGNLISKKVQIFNPKNVIIGKGTYFNAGQMHAGENSKIIIGNWCSIGYNVHIKSKTHDPSQPTGTQTKIIEADIIIGDNVWIGDNVYIKQGIKIENHVIIGANSIVTKNIPSNTVYGGCPAKLLYNN